MLAFIVGLKAEEQILAPLGVRVFVGGGTTQGAALAARAAIAAGARALVSFGLAGGLAPELPAGKIIIPRQVILFGRSLAADPDLSHALGGFTSTRLLAGDAIVGSIAGKRERRREMDADAVDLESGAVADAALRAEIRFGVIRAICDPADRALPPAAMVALKPSGAVGLARVAASVLRQPGQISALVALSRDAAFARAALVKHVAELKHRSEFAPWAALTPILR